MVSDPSIIFLWEQYTNIRSLNPKLSLFCFCVCELCTVMYIAYALLTCCKYYQIKNNNKSLQPCFTISCFFITLLPNQCKISKIFNPMRTTCRLVTMRIWSYIEPITECARKNSLICKFLMHCYQTCYMIGLTNDQIMVLTNHVWC